MTHATRILLHHVHFSLPTHKDLFKALNLTFLKRKTGLVGRNGIGKSSLIKLITGELTPDSGSIHIEGQIAYVPQSTTYSPTLSIAAVLDSVDKLEALRRITQGSIDEYDFSILNDDWEIESRLKKQLSLFGLENISPLRSLQDLSGGELTRLYLVKAFSSHADFLLLDEPTNHLDASARQQLYQTIQAWPGGLVVVSHDRTLLNLMDDIVELSTIGAACYGGSYDAYAAQKNIELAAKTQHLQDAKTAMQKTKGSIQDTREKHTKKKAYGKELRRSGSIDKLAANSKQGRSERTQSKNLVKEQRMLEQAETRLSSTKEKIEIYEEIHITLPKTKVPQGKTILAIEDLCFSYPHSPTSLIENFNLRIEGPTRLALSGDNGSGKTTLIKLILGQLHPQQGKILLGTKYISYLDQDTSLLNSEHTVLENFLQLNPDAKENDAYRCLAQFLFRNTAALSQVKNLSGGEKIRVLLACVLMSTHPPQILILDEPTNHLDLHSIKSIESALENYEGAMIVISHDQTFLSNIGVKTRIEAPFKKRPAG